ncbi:MAG: hypothetical protein H6917_08610 [Novosphingobium sp.]|nr:hypothetical protein [Novosphingobium sp.]MCP5402436.1 hypothetical protein [Novosphingobium sp.]
MPKIIQLLLVAFALACPQSAIAGDALPGVRLEIASRETAFGGQTFGDYGTYERITGVAHMRIDPQAAANRGIVDLELAPRDADGMVAYDVDVVILRPSNAEKARRILVYEVVNRGIKLFSMYTGGTPMNDADPGDGFPFRRGYTLVWSGWQGDIASPKLLGARFPVATKDGKPVTGTVSTEKIFDSLDGTGMELPYSAASVGRSNGLLTVSARTGETPTVIPRSHWRFTDDRHIEIERPESMDAGAIYRFQYTARDPKVMGLGFAATRDLVSWLRHASAADGNPLAELAKAPCERGSAGDCANPEGGVFSSAIAFGASQSGRYLRDYLWRGFNRDLAGRRVFDGVIPFIPGARQTFTNYRFAEPGRFSRQHEDHHVPGFTFPFTYASLTDSVTGKRDGILQSCSESGTCPKVFHIDTSGEFWQAAASLVGTGGTDHDVVFPANVRAYMIAGGAHAPGMTMTACRYPPNPLDYTPAVRALLVAMIDWASDQATPPDSLWPRLADRELRRIGELDGPQVPSAGLVWPKVLNSPVPPEGKPDWPVFVPAIDSDGNDFPGIRLPDLAAPKGTYLSWNLRKAGYAENELCLIFGSYLPFAKDAAARAGDTRPSLAERYPSAGDREKRFREAVTTLREDGLLLEEDAERLEGTLR